MSDEKNYFSSDFKLGILGGGQLGKMMLTETRRYDIRTKVLDPNDEAPCRIAANEFETGSLTDKERVLEFAKDCDVITIEIENVNTDALKELQEQGKKVYPKPETLELIKNKVTQKHFYRENDIPTAPFFDFKNREELKEKLVEKENDPPFVWKAATGGYDGRGVQVVKKRTDLEVLPDEGGLIEEMISFEKEIAVIVARSPSGEVKSYPIVEMEFHPEANLVEYVVCPADIDQELEEAAKKLAEEVVQKLDHVGLLAVEMFALRGGELLVNEVAPRVHNSGHLTIEGNVTSQFDQHLRAILDLPLGETEIVRPAVMINLNGAKDFEGPVHYENIEKLLKMEGCYVHLYGKAETRPFRKMGHVTITATSRENAREKAREVKNDIRVISKK